MTQDNKINVAVNVLLVKDGKILLGKRLGAAGAGAYGVPGGHVIPGNSLVEEAKRELFEETGVVPEDMKFLHISSSLSLKPYLHINFLVTKWQGEITAKEPDRCEGWEWFTLDNLPKNIFRPHLSFIKAYLENKAFYEDESE